MATKVTSATNYSIFEERQGWVWVPGREQEGKGGIEGNEGNDNTDDTKEKDAAWSFVSFFLKKETKDPWPRPLPSLGDVMIDPDPEYLVVQTTKHKHDNIK